MAHVNENPKYTQCVENGFTARYATHRNYIRKTLILISITTKFRAIWAFA